MSGELSRERDALLRYIESLHLHEEVKKDYCNRIRLAFYNLSSGGDKGYFELRELERKIPPNQRSPVSESLIRIKTWQLRRHEEIKKPEKKRMDLAIMCALKDPELNRILDLLFDKTSITTDELGEIGSHTYYLGSFRSLHNPDKSLKVVAAHQVMAGIADSAILASKLIQRWKPRYLVMTGVCGGRKSVVRLGDIVVPSEIFTYQTGEFADEGFKHEPKVVNMNHGLTERIQAADWIPYEIVKSWPGEKRDPPRVYTYPLACGDAVINKKGMLEEDVASLNRKVAGVDMESYAVLRAASLFSECHTIPLVIKSVMDFTEEKNACSDMAFAAFASAQFLYHFALSELTN